MGYKCYNGCPGPKLQALLDEEARANRAMKKLSPEAHCTYFPMEQHFEVWVGLRQLTSGDNTRLQAITKAIALLEVGRIK